MVWISLAGIVLGLITWAILGVGSPFTGQLSQPPSATPELAAQATEPIWALPTLPVNNWSGSPLGESQAKVGTAAPDFELKQADGTVIRLTNYAGKVVVLNFWASWCPPCRDEMPDLQSLATGYADQGLVVLGIHTTYADSRTAGQKFVEELGITFPILFDEQGIVTEESYGVLGLPVTYWIDQGGVVRYINIGPMTHADMVTRAQEYLTP